MSKEQEAMKVWEQMRANDDDVEVVGDNAGLDDYNFDADADHDHNDYGGFEGVGGDESSVARGGPDPFFSLIIQGHPERMLKVNKM